MSRVHLSAIHLGGAVARGLISKDEIAGLLQVGHKAASGDNAAIEIQAAYEIAGDGEVSAETKKAMDAVLSVKPETPKPNPLFSKPA